MTELEYGCRNRLIKAREISYEYDGEYSYGTYGELLSGDASKTKFLYNGQYGIQTDSNNLYYMRSRYYNPEVKRFINQDILVGDIKNSQSLNRYAYVQGNPITLTDPFGTNPIDQINKFLSVTGHTLFGIASFFSPLGDLAEAYLYYKEGDTKNAFKCLLSLIPADKVLDFVGKGLKVAYKGARKAGRAIKKTAGIVTNAVARAYRAGEKGPIRKIVRTLTGRSGNKAAKAIDTASDVAKKESYWSKFMKNNGGFLDLDGFKKGSKSGSTTVDIYSFGNKSSPRGARPKQDFNVENFDSIVGPEIGPLPKGASNVLDVNTAPLSGHYHKLPAGTQMPDGLDIIADGIDVISNSPHGVGHHTISQQEK